MEKQKKLVDTFPLTDGSLLEKSILESGGSMSLPAVSEVISPELIDLINASLSPETIRCYQTDCRRFREWLDETYRGANPEIVTQDRIAQWITWMHGKGYRYSSITRGLSALQAFYPDLSPVISTAMVRAALRGARRQQAEDGRVTVRAKPVSPDELERMCSVWTVSSTRGLRNRAIMRLGWLCAARISEICALRIWDLEWTDEGLAVLIRRSKTDQDGEGVAIGIPRCDWLSEIRGWFERSKFLQKSFNPPLFPRFRRGPDQYQASILERPSLSVRGARDMVDYSARKAGLTGISPHSFRAGLITFAASIGVPERLIAAHSRHSTMRVLRGYIRRGSIWQDNALDLVVRRLNAPSESESVAELEEVITEVVELQELAELERHGQLTESEEK
jgi:integrase